jgi:hypothetical protein
MTSVFSKLTLILLMFSLQNCATSSRKKTVKKSSSKKTVVHKVDTSKGEAGFNVQKTMTTVQVPGEESTTDGEVILARYQATRFIKMLYKVDLRKNNGYARMVAEPITANEEKLRNCYSNRLDYEPKLKGELALRFYLDKSSRTMQNITKTGGTINDTRLISCLTGELSKITFKTPHSMPGQLTYLFDVKEQTVAQPPPAEMLIQPASL